MSRLALASIVVALVVGAVAATPVRAPVGQGRLPDVRSFVTRPDLQAPAIRVRTRTPEASRGKVFVGPKVGPGGMGPMILDSRGGLVWFNDLPGRELAFDFRVQRYRGKPVLTWWQGRVQHGHGKGFGVIADSSYRVVARVRAQNGYQADLHEFQLTARGTALLTIYRTVKRDLSSIGGPRDGTAVDSVIQEVDVRTGRLLFEWHSLDHVALRESYWKKPTSSTELYDYFHVNSIEVMRDGNLLISARNTSALYKIDRRSGRVIWRLGGKKSDFALGRDVALNGQHDARLLPDGTIVLFDNGFPPAVGRQSRVIVLRLDRAEGSAELVRSYYHPRAPHSHSQGGQQVLPNGNVFVGWGGGMPNFSEYTREGKLVFDARFASPKATSYRAYRFPWAGRPVDRPRAAARAADGGMSVYASWNGATEVARWRVLAGPRPGALSRVATVKKEGFETSVAVKREAPVVVVVALARDGRVLGRSAPAGLGH